MPHFTGFFLGLYILKIILYLNPTVDSSIAMFLPGKKCFLKPFLYMFCHPTYCLCSSDGPITFFGGIISPHASSKLSANSDLWTLHHQEMLSTFSSH
jgi:hypothetical protein